MKCRIIKNIVTIYYINSIYKQNIKSSLKKRLNSSANFNVMYYNINK